MALPLEDVFKDNDIPLDRAEQDRIDPLDFHDFCDFLRAPDRSTSEQYMSLTHVTFTSSSIRVRYNWK